MRPRFLLVVSGLGLTVGMAVLACGDEYGETPPGTGSSSGAPSSGSSGASSSSSGTNPVETPTLGATSLKVECGKETCDVDTQQCCIGGANDLKCQPKNQGCGNDKGSATCDDSADCTDPGKTKCCGEAQGFNKSNTRCVEKCDGITSAQSCRTNEECGGQDCIRQSCFGFESWLCGLNNFCQKL